MVEVARHPEVQQRIQSEIHAVVPEDVRYLLPSHLAQLTYLECVIKEGMRLWPVAALGSMRLASKDIPYNDYIIPKGSMLMIPFYPLFRTADIQVWSEYTYIHYRHRRCDYALPPPPVCMCDRIPRAFCPIAGRRMPMAPTRRRSSG